MTLDETSKFFLGWIVTFGTFAASSYLNFYQGIKIKSELLEKFEIAIEKSQKHSATEIFRLIHGLRMSYIDIIELIKHDECSKIIHVLKETPGIVRYENGQFSFSSLGKNHTFQLIDRVFTWLCIVFFSILIPISAFYFIFSKGTNSIVGFISMIIGSIIMPIIMKKNRYDQMVSSLIHRNDNGHIAEAITDDQC